MIHLEILQEQDLEFCRKLRNDNCKYFLHSKKITKKQHSNWYDLYSKSTGYYFYIIKCDNMRIGTISNTVDYSSSSFEIGNVVIDESFRRKGYLRDAINILREINPHLDKVKLRVRGDNKDAIEAYKKIGFKVRTMTMEL